MEQLSGAAMIALDDEGLGAFRRALPWGSYGMLARASISAPTLGVALARWCRHHRLLTDDLTLRVAEQGATATISIESDSDLNGQREFALVHVLRNIHGLACWYIDSRIPLLDACFPFPRPPHAEAFAHLFQCPHLFDVDRAEIRFESAYLHQPLRRDERSLRQMLQRALPLTVLQYRRDRLLVQQVRQVLAAWPDASHTASTVAARLNLSARTLHRQLRQEEASLQDLKDEVRHERACNLLLRTRKPIKQVAADVGFRNEKSFSRAFRGWAGMGPAEWRSRQQVQY